MTEQGLVIMFGALLMEQVAIKAGQEIYCTWVDEVKPTYLNEDLSLMSIVLELFTKMSYPKMQLLSF